MRRRNGMFRSQAPAVQEYAVPRCFPDGGVTTDHPVGIETRHRDLRQRMITPYFRQRRSACVAHGGGRRI